MHEFLLICTTDIIQLPHFYSSSGTNHCKVRHWNKKKIWKSPSVQICVIVNSLITSRNVCPMKKVWICFLPSKLMQTYGFVQVLSTQLVRFLEETRLQNPNLCLYISPLLHFPFTLEIPTKHIFQNLKCLSTKLADSRQLLLKFVL